MFAAPGIAQTDHLHPFGLLQNHIVAARDGDFGPLRTKEFRRGGGPASSQKEEGDKRFHPLNLPQRG